MATSKKRRAAGSRKRRPRCRICDKPIPIPKGWTQGPAVRKHYWANHREVMSSRAEKRSDKTPGRKGKSAAKASSKTGRGRARANDSAGRKKARS